MEKNNMSKRQLQGAETKKKIFQAARQLVMERGIENVSVDSIVEAADLSKGAFYVHFKSKDALAAELVKDFTGIADMDYKSFLTEIFDKESVLDILALMSGEISSFIENNIGLENMRVLYKAYLTKTIDTSPVTSYDRELYKIFMEILERGIQKEELRKDISVDSLAKHLIMSIRGITFEWCIRYPDFNLQEQVLEHFKIILYGLRKWELFFR